MVYTHCYLLSALSGHPPLCLLLQKVVASEVDDNNLLAQVLGVLALLVKYGYYDDSDDVDDVLRPLMEILSGFSDIPFPSIEEPVQR